MNIELGGFAWWLLFLAVFWGNLIETIAGFGSVLIALSILLLVNFDIDSALAWLVPLNMALSIWLLTQNFKDVLIRYLFAQLLPLLLGGFLLGSYFNTILPPVFLKKIFGSLILLLSLRAFFQQKHTEQPSTRYLRTFWLLLGGIVHGLFSTGGPMVVYVASQSNLSKSQFRSTLAALWVILNGLMISRLIYFNTLNINSLITSVSLTPALILSIAVGNFLFYRISETYFRKIVYGMLLIAGVLFLIQ